MFSRELYCARPTTCQMQSDQLDALISSMSDHADIEVVQENTVVAIANIAREDRAYAHESTASDLCATLIRAHRRPAQPRPGARTPDGCTRCSTRRSAGSPTRSR